VTAPIRIPPDYLTPAEAIDLLRLRGKQQFYRLVREGHLPVIRLGRLIRVPRKSLDACLRVRA
jgi:excisionase family DNA binding protein